ncbi:unnamed protein product [Clonostachys byssicola]|uniref:NACHT domain-containing protein n=1 Tax=Clonostachys byssicola TaxID=160290 RepID=A0A9N9Y824_9HYPO|nr:unnamed protein product [Clonostachys byssicola]
MSGFEILGLACAIFQTISFAHETLNVCIALYDRQKTPDDEVEDIANSMVVAAEKVTSICDENQQLKKEISQIAADCKNDALGEEIARIAKECIKIASQLKSEVGKITSLAAKGDFLITMKAASMSLWKKPKLKKLNENLCSYREQMQTLLITQIWAIAKSNNLTQNSNFHNRDGDVQDFIANLEAGCTKIEDLLKRQAASAQAHITDEVGIAKQEIKDHSESLLKAHEKDATTKAQHERLQKSLEYPDMNSRRNAILEPRDATFGRIFRSYTNTINSSNSPNTKAIDKVWQSFVDWLRSHEPVFWIQGKPGAGKSTLMKYIVNHEETQKLLGQWCPQSRILSHYFWKIGSTMENNLQGLYCSLIHQLIDENEAIFTRILHEFPFVKKKTYVNDWSTPELDSVLDYILDSAVDRNPVCIFIDGLDEYRGGQKDLIGRMKGFSQHEQVKLCVSSRPEERLLEGFDTTPNLKLQDLTKPDMISSIEERLGVFERRGQISSETLDTIAKLLIVKAEGVFLWLQLTLQSIENGIENEDSNEFLIMRLKDLPSDIMDLYADMWTRLNQDLKVYRESAALFFQFLIQSQEHKQRKNGIHLPSHLPPHVTSLFDIACWKDQDLQTRLLNIRCETRSEEIVYVCGRTEKEIRTRCAGLLEVKPLDWSPESDFNNILRRVDFVHRTAHDFLADTAAGQQILSWGKLSMSETVIQMTKGAFCKSRIKARFATTEYLPDPMSALEDLLVIQADEKDWVTGAGEWFVMAESFYDAGLLEERILPRPSFLGHIAFYPGLCEAATPLFQKAEASVATEVLRLWQWWYFFSSHRSHMQKAIRLMKAVPQLMSCGPDLEATQAYVPVLPWSPDGPTMANRTTALWEFGQKSLMWGLDWRTERTARNEHFEPMFAQTLVALMSRPTTLYQVGLVTTVEIYPGGRLHCVRSIDQLADMRDAAIVSPLFMLNTSFLIKHALDGLLTHCPDKMTAQLHKIRGQITNSVPRIAFIHITSPEKARWYRVIDHTPFQDITHVIFDPTIPLDKPDAKLEQSYR